MLPALAAQAGLRLSAGVWLDSRRPNNEREIAAIIDAVPRHPGIERVIAGNESQLRGVLAPSELYGYLDRLRSRAAGAGVDRRALACLAAPAGAGRPCGFHHRASAALLGGATRRHWRSIMRCNACASCASDFLASRW
jgi:hypothetical protein